MFAIVPNILSLKQYLEILFKNSGNYRPLCCPACGKNGLWGHGHYDRKPDRSPAGSQNPVPILRFMCPNCGKTHSVFPECIPPRRWYLWLIQEAVLLRFLAGKSVRSASKIPESSPSRSTCKRWWENLKAKFLPQAAALRTWIADLGRYAHFEEFWQKCLNLMPLSKAMRLCHQQGAQIP